MSRGASLTPFLHKMEARSWFTAEEREAILGLPFTPRQIQTNRDFVERGERVTHSCFVLEGMVGTFGQTRNGARQITSVFISGDMINLQAVALPEALSALQALTTTTILLVPHSALRQVGQRHPNVAEAFWRECVVETAIINEWVVNVGRRDARSGMAHLFCELACRSGRARPEDNFTFPFPVTQNHLGDMLGLTPVHVNRTLQGLREDRLVEVGRGVVQILNWDRLEKIGDFDANYLQLGIKEDGRNAAACGAPKGQTAA